MPKIAVWVSVYAHPKEFSGPFAVGCRDDGGVNLEESAFLVKLVDLPGECVSDPQDRLMRIGSRPQMRNGPQMFKARALLLQWIGGRVATADNFHFVRQDLDGLFAALAFDPTAADAYSGSRTELSFELGIGVRLQYHLYGLGTRTIKEVNETDILREP